MDLNHFGKIRYYFEFFISITIGEKMWSKKKNNERKLTDSKMRINSASQSQPIVEGFAKISVCPSQVHASNPILQIFMSNFNQC